LALPVPTCRSGFSIFAPAGTPKDVLGKPNAKIVEIAAAEDTRGASCSPSTRGTAADARRNWPGTS